MSAAATISVSLNGEPRELAAGTTVAQLVQSLPGSAGRVAVEVNRVIVPRSTHAQHSLAADDVIEIVTFVGGG